MPNMLLRYESLNRQDVENLKVHHPSFRAEETTPFSCKTEDSILFKKIKKLYIP